LPLHKKEDPSDSERERETDTPRREGKRPVWLKYPSAIDLFLLSVEILYLYLCYEKMVTGGENSVILIDSGHTYLHELGYKQELKCDLS